MHRPIDTAWTADAAGTESRQRASYYLAVDLYNRHDGTHQWSVTDGEPDGQPCKAAGLAATAAAAAARRAAEEAADELAQED